LTLDGWTLLVGIMAAAGVGIGAYFVGRWWLVPVPLLVLVALWKVVNANESWYERFPEDVQFAVYSSLCLAAVGIFTGVLAAKLERRRPSQN